MISLKVEQTFIYINDVSKSNFALVIDYFDKNLKKKHITIAYLNNFILYNNKPVKKILAELVEIWYKCLDEKMPKGGFKNYDINRSNEFLILPNGQSLWFIPNNSFSLNELIVNFHKSIHLLNFELKYPQIKVGFPYSITYNMPSNPTNVRQIYSHTDLQIYKNGLNLNDAINLIPKSIDLRILNIM